MDLVLQKKIEDTLWVAHTLFDRGKATGSSANISFFHDEKIYISASGTCFGTLKADDFSVVTMDGTHVEGKNASKELPLHIQMYQKDEMIQAVIHTHSFYATLWSCLGHENKVDCIPEYTPYLKMKLGTVGLIPYGKPGSEALFGAFAERIGFSDGFLLANHGPVVGGKDMMDAFYCLEELEESARIAWELEGKGKEVRRI